MIAPRKIVCSQTDRVALRAAPSPCKLGRSPSKGKEPWSSASAKDIAQASSWLERSQWELDLPTEPRRRLEVSASAHHRASPNAILRHALAHSRTQLAYTVRDRVHALPWKRPSAPSGAILLNVQMDCTHNSRVRVHHSCLEAIYTTGKILPPAKSAW